MEDVIVPSYYVVNRDLPKEEASVVLQALRVTPCQCVVISDVLDASLALELCSELIRARDDAHALDIAALVWNETKRPALVVGVANFLDAVYADGRRESVATAC